MYITTFSTNINNNNIAFKSVSDSTFRKAERKEFVNNNLAIQAESLIEGYKDICKSLSSLEQIENTQDVKKLCSDIKKSFSDDNKYLLLNEDGKNILFTVMKDNGIEVLQKDDKTSEIVNKIILKDRKILNKNKADTEKYLESVFDAADYKILEMRKKINSFLNQIHASQAKPKYRPRVLDKVEPKLVNDVINLFTETKETLRSFDSPNTRVRVRNSYPYIKESKKSAMSLDFVGVGPLCEDMSINYLTNKGQKFLLIKIHDKDATYKNIVIKPTGEVVRTHLHNFLRQRKTVDETLSKKYFLPEECILADYTNYLKTAKIELEKFNKFLKIKLQKLEENKNKFTPQEAGTTKDYTPLVENVKEDYIKLKKQLEQIHTADSRKYIKNKLGFETRAGQPALLLKNVTPLGENILVSFPVIDNQKCTKIALIDKNETVRKILFIKDEKLVKISNMRLDRMVRKDANFYYHTQEEIDKSNLRYYLEMIDEKLTELDESIKKERKNKTIK